MVPCHGIVEFSKVFLLEGTFVTDFSSHESVVAAIDIKTLMSKIS